MNTNETLLYAAAAGAGGCPPGEGDTKKWYAVYYYDDSIGDSKRFKVYAGSGPTEADAVSDVRKKAKEDWRTTHSDDDDVLDEPTLEYVGEVSDPYDAAVGASEVLGLDEVCGTVYLDAVTVRCWWAVVDALGITDPDLRQYTLAWSSARDLAKQQGADELSSLEYYLGRPGASTWCWLGGSTSWTGGKEGNDHE